MSGVQASISPSVRLLPGPPAADRQVQQLRSAAAGERRVTAAAAVKWPPHPPIVPRTRHFVPLHPASPIINLRHVPFHWDSLPCAGPGDAGPCLLTNLAGRRGRLGISSYPSTPSCLREVRGWASLPHFYCKSWERGWNFNGRIRYYVQRLFLLHILDFF